MVSFIAIRASRPGGFAVPIQIQAQALRERQARAPAGGMGFAILPEAPSAPADADVTGGRTRWLEDDLKRAIGAAREAGLRDYRVEIAPGGTISIVVGAPSATTADRDSGGLPDL